MVRPVRYEPQPLALPRFTETNDQHIARYTNRGNPGPLPMNSVTLAFGNWSYPKLTKQLDNRDLVVRRKALMSLMDLCHKPQNVALAIKADVTPALTNLLSDPDVVVRTYTTDVLATMAQHNIAVPPMLECRTYEKLVSMLGEESQALRDNIYRCLIHSCKVSGGLQRIVECNIVREITTRLGDEPPEIKTHMLTLLWFTIKTTEALMQALVQDTIKEVGLCLTSEVMLVKEIAARTLTALCYPFDGKLQALEANLTGPLLDILADLEMSDKCRQVAASAICAITVEEKGKQAVIDSENFPDFLIQPLEDANDAIKLNLVKIMGNVAENVKGREGLLPWVSVLESLRDTTGDKLLIKHTKSAIKIITFIP